MNDLRSRDLTDGRALCGPRGSGLSRNPVEPAEMGDGASAALPSETKPHTSVCSGKVTLKTVQQAIVSDWTTGLSRLGLSREHQSSGRRPHEADVLPGVSFSRSLYEVRALLRTTVEHS